MSKNTIKRKKNSGYTMIELLAVIAILSIVSTIVIYTATNIVTSAKETSYKVTVNNVQKESNTYVLENESDIVWIPSSDGISEYQCVSVQNLIDMGYFDNDILDSKVSENRQVLPTDNIYIERNINNKSISKNIYDYYNGLGLCNQADLDAKIIFYVPNGWAKSKEVSITYNLLKKEVSDINEYKYSYSFENKCPNDLSLEKCQASFPTIVQKKTTVKEKITVEENGWVFASIEKSTDTLRNESIYVNKIDRIAPNIEITEQQRTTVKKSATIPIKIYDNESGVDGNTISISDFKVSIGQNVLDKSNLELTKTKYNKYNPDGDEYIYNLIVNDIEHTGEVKIEVDADVIFDNVGNGNLAKTFNTGIVFDNTYTINYNGNGSTGGSMPELKCTYGENCTLSKNGFTKTGYTFNVWNTRADGKETSYDDQYEFKPFKLDNDVKLYAQWKANTYTIKFDANGGQGSIANLTCKYDSDCRLEQNNFTKTGYTFSSWNEKRDGTGTSYHNNTFKNLSSIDGATVTVYAQWTENEKTTYTVTFNSSGGTSVASQTVEAGSKATKPTNPTRTGYTFAGWTLNGRSYDFNSTVNSNITLVAQWTENSNNNNNNVTYTIAYNYKNGQSNSANPTKGTVDEVLTINNPTKTVTITGNVNNTGATIKGSPVSQTQTFTGLTYSNGNTSTAKYGSSESSVTTAWSNQNTKVTSKYFKNLRNSTGTVTLTANWQEKEVTLPTVSKTGYSCTWNTNSDGTGTTYTSGDKYTIKDNSETSIILYARCSADSKYKVDYEVNIFSPFDSSRTIKDNNQNAMLNINYNHITSNLTFNSIKSTSRLNNLIIGLNPLSLSSGDKYEIILTYVSGSINGGSVNLKVGYGSSPESVSSSTSIQLPTSSVKSSTITISGSAKYLKQWLSSTNAANITFNNYVVNVVIRKKIEGATPNGLTQEYTPGDKYILPNNLSVPVKLGYKDITAWRLLNGKSWGNSITNNTTITLEKDHKVYAKLTAKTLKISYIDKKNKSIGLSDTTYTYDSLEGDGVPDQTTIKAYNNDKGYVRWRFKINANGQELWFGCLDDKVEETASGSTFTRSVDINANLVCWGQINPSIGWYPKNKVKVFYQAEMTSNYGMNMSNFLGFDAYAVAVDCKEANSQCD